MFIRYVPFPCPFSMSDPFDRPYRFREILSVLDPPFAPRIVPSMVSSSTPWRASSA